MPLTQSSSPEAFKGNLKAELAAGKPQKQALAIAYSVKRQNRAAGGPVNVLPSQAQKEAGNYKKAHVTWNGLDISIENPKGSTRSGTGKDGKPWSVRMPDHYGYIKRTSGADGDHVDVYLGPDRASDKVFVVDQVDHDTKNFDEHKAMLGYRDKASALSAYRSAFSDGRGGARVGAVTELSVDAFKAWLRGAGAKKPIGSFAAGGGVLARIMRADGGPVHVGPIHSAVGGRTDHLAMQVPEGAYVIPADVVSGLGEGNTANGQKILQGMFPEGRATGGVVPIMAAGGEHVIHPEAVKKLGGGDIDRGHAILDRWVIRQRKNTVKTLKKLPGPSR